MEKQKLKTEQQIMGTGLKGNDLPYLLFTVGNRVLAMNVDDINGMQRFNRGQVTAVPTENNNMRGVTLYKGDAISVFGMREFFGIPSMKEEHESKVNLSQRVRDHEDWVDKLEESVLNNTEFTLTNNPDLCTFGQWLNKELKSNQNNIVVSALRQVVEPHRKVHAYADSISALMKQGKNSEAIAMIKNLRKNELTTIKKLLNRLDQTIVDQMREISITLKQERKEDDNIKANDVKRDKYVNIIVDDIIGVEKLKLKKLPSNKGIEDATYLDSIGQRDERNFLKHSNKGTVALILKSKELQNALNAGKDNSKGDLVETELGKEG